MKHCIVPHEFNFMFSITLKYINLHTKYKEMFLRNSITAYVTNNLKSQSCSKDTMGCTRLA